MPRTPDPNSIASRILQCFRTGQSFVAYEAPAGLPESALPTKLDAAVLRLRPAITQARKRAAEAAVDAGADYNTMYPGDAHKSVTVWYDLDLACVFVGRRPKDNGLPRLRSIEARAELEPGESALITLSNRSVRDTNGWLRSKADEVWRRDRIAPQFTVALADPSKPTLAEDKLDYIITRGPDTTQRPGAWAAGADCVEDPGEPAPDPNHPPAPADHGDHGDHFDVAAAQAEAKEAHAAEQKRLRAAFEAQTRAWRAIHAEEAPVPLTPAVRDAWFIYRNDFTNRPAEWSGPPDPLRFTDEERASFEAAYALDLAADARDEADDTPGADPDEPSHLELAVRAAWQARVERGKARRATEAQRASEPNTPAPQST